MFDKPIETAKKLIAQIVKKGDTVVDMTAGNGHDTVFLVNLTKMFLRLTSKSKQSTQHKNCLTKPVKA